MNKGRRDQTPSSSRMSGMKYDLIWSPHHQNRYIAVGTDIQLYEIEEIKNGATRESGFPLSDSTVGNLLATNSDYPYLKCVSWYPKPQHDQLLAIGLANGKVILSCFGENLDDLAEFSGREFIPRHCRPCNCIAWNPNESKLLACGLEKYRADCGLLIWDVTRPLYTTSEAIASLDKHHSPINVFSVDTPNIARPAAELGMSESTQSLHWFNHNAHLVVCGMNNKCIRIYDTRDSAKHQNSTPTKAVFGVCVDPYFEHRLASVFENLFVLWDVRNFEKPVITTHEQKQILKICWCPTRSSVLTALMKDTNIIKLYNIQSLTGNDELEPAIVERSVQPFDSCNVMSFAWHLTEENRMITIAQNNSMKDYTVFDRITLNWSPRSEIVWTYGKKVLHFIDSNDKFYQSLDDISVKMRRRACQGYGLKVDAAAEPSPDTQMQQVWTNGALSEDPGLLGVWVWLDLVKEYRSDKKSESKSSLKFEGVHTIICGEKGTSTLSISERRQVSWVGLNFSSCKMTKYVSEERERALQLCGWGSEADSSTFSAFLERLESEGKYMRAASIAVFTLDIRRAIEILNRGAASKKNSDVIDFNAIAMSLAGYTEERNALWREISSNLKSRLKDPHLRAMFTFLTEEGDNYDDILNESGIAVQDQLAVGLMYLPDKKLAEFLDRLKAKMLDMGLLDGILLTGLTNDGLSLIQKYVDRNADVQTASLIVLHTLPSPLSSHPRALAWVDAYREFLDMWRLWKQRALFDVQWYKACPADSKPPQQVFLSCTFCGKSVLSYLQHSSTPANSARYSQIQASTANISKVTCCPGCKKPLPRCALCLCRMGTPAGMHWKRPVEGKHEKKLTEFSNWLTWCQTCRHGGHSVHILGWFQEHSECPVTGCTCKCMSLDSVAKLGFADSGKPKN